MSEPAVRNRPARRDRYQSYREGQNASLRSVPSPRGEREYVGDGQAILLNFPVGYVAGTATAFDVVLDHVPTDALQYSGVKQADGVDGTCQIWEVHDDDHEWTHNRVWFACNRAEVSQKWLII